MRCKICDAPLDNPQYNHKWKEWDPCRTCLDVIDSVFDDYVEEEEERKDEDDDTADITPIIADG